MMVFKSHVIFLLEWFSNRMLFVFLFSLISFLLTSGIYNKTMSKAKYIKIKALQSLSSNTVMETRKTF